MIATQNLSKLSRRAVSFGSIVFMSAIFLGSNMAVAASGDAATASSNTASNAESVVSDSWITTKVKSEILANSASKALKVNVKTKHGAVSLKGKLPNQDAIDLVKMISEKVKGVKSVDVTGLVIGAE